MNSPTDTQNQSPTSPSAQRQLGYWLRAIDHSISSAMHNAFAQQGIGRRSWRTLSVIADGATSIDEIDAATPPRRGRSRDERAERFARDEHHGRPERAEHPGRPTREDAAGRDDERGPRGPHSPRGPHGRFGNADQFGPEGKRRRSTQQVVDGLAERGWVTTDGGITVTGAGREAHTALLAQMSEIRSTVTDTVSPEDLTITLASLEAIARGFGWDESTANERGPRGRRGHGPHGHRGGARFHGRGEGRGTCGARDERPEADDRSERPDTRPATAPKTTSDTPAGNSQE